MSNTSDGHNLPGIVIRPVATYMISHQPGEYAPAPEISGRPYTECDAQIVPHLVLHLRHVHLKWH
jgi:hypothetical protein